MFVTILLSIRKFKTVTADRFTYSSILCWVRCDVLKRPLHVLMLGKLPCERTRLKTRHTKDTVICWQHGSIEHHHILIFMVSPAQRLKFYQCLEEYFVAVREASVLPLLKLEPGLGTNSSRKLLVQKESEWSFTRWISRIPLNYSEWQWNVASPPWNLLVLDWVTGSNFEHCVRPKLL